jgi:hypothetical protein
MARAAVKASVTPTEFSTPILSEELFGGLLALRTSAKETTQET